MKGGNIGQIEWARLKRMMVGMGGLGTCWEGGRVKGLRVYRRVSLPLFATREVLITDTHTHQYKYKRKTITLHISKIRSKICDLKQDAGQDVITKKVAVVCVWPLPCNIIILISSLLLEHATHRVFYTCTIKLKAKYVKCTLQPVPVNARHISAFVHKKNPGRILPFRLLS